MQGHGIWRSLAILRRPLDAFTSMIYLVCFFGGAFAVQAQTSERAEGRYLGRLATFDADRSYIRDVDGGISLNLLLSQIVPYKVFLLDSPDRIVLDFQIVDWAGISSDINFSAHVRSLRVGQPKPGWSRLVFDMNAAFEVKDVDFSASGSGYVLSLTARPEKEAGHIHLAKPSLDEQGDTSQGSGWWSDVEPPQFRPLSLGGSRELPQDKKTLIVVVDAGHGGHDSGAQRAGVKESDVMLALAIELSERLNRTLDVRAVLTRHDDRFIPLEERMSLARLAHADLFLSLHADSLEGGGAHGASIYTLSARGVSQATQRMAERHERADIIAGLDLTQQDDRVATILMDMARAQTSPSAKRLANHMVKALRGSGAGVNSKPRREGVFAVLMSADFSSLLVEAGFLSSAKDRAALQTKKGRQPIVEGLARAIMTWRDDELARQPLLRR